MSIIQDINNILTSNVENKAELIENLIPIYSWADIVDCLIAILMDDNRAYEDWQTAAEVFWGAVLDKRDIPSDKLIALLYHRLKPDPDSLENNLVWSITSKLKNVDYFSDYDPAKDPKVINEAEKMGFSL